jgi:hypothetical protein
MLQEDKDWIARKIRKDFDSAGSRSHSDFYRYEFRLECIERAKRFGLTDLAEELRKDL